MQVSIGATKAYDRIGGRAWRLAVWLTGDDELANAAVIRAFADHAEVNWTIWSDDAVILRSVRACAIAMSGVMPVDVASARGRCAALPPMQREVVELAFIGGLDVESIARATRRTVGDVRQQLLRGGRVLSGSVADGRVRAQV